MARTRKKISKEPGNRPSEIMQEHEGLVSGRKKKLQIFSRVNKSNYVPSAEFDILMGDSKHIEIFRRARLRELLHKEAMLKRYTMRTEQHGANYLKEQLDNSYPESEAYYRSLKLMATRKVND
jgi:hypothetical protein